MDTVETSSVQKTVNSRPEVAYGILCLSFYPPSSVDDTKKFSIEKLFGLVKEDNSVLKFRILVSGSWERKSETLFDLKVSHKVYYLSDEPIHCDLTIKDHAGERYSIIHTSMSHKNLFKIISTHCVQFPGRNMRKLISLYHFLLILLSLLILSF